MLGLKRGTVVLRSSHARWKTAYAAECARLGAFLPKTVAIEHIGSTAVPGLKAKPIIDILIGYASAKEREAIFGRLRDKNYLDRGERDPHKRWLFVKGSDKTRTFHIHIVKKNSRSWQSCLGFRDLLRKNAKLRNDYSLLKQTLAGRCQFDRKAYTAGKMEYIESILKVF
jgi:GrpB-like predicted nucleotidyltransferase (UPF0157 family)